MSSIVTAEMLKQQKIAVLFGGDSAEREVSLKSGAAITNGLVKAGYNVTSIDTQGFNLAELTTQGLIESLLLCMAEVVKMVVFKAH